MGLSGCWISKGTHGKQVVNDLREEHISFKKLYLILPYQHVSALPSVYPSLCHPICTQAQSFRFSTLSGSLLQCCHLFSLASLKSSSVGCLLTACETWHDLPPPRVSLPQANGMAPRVCISGQGVNLNGWLSRICKHTYLFYTFRTANLLCSCCIHAPAMFTFKSYLDIWMHWQETLAEAVNFRQWLQQPCTELICCIETWTPVPC